MTRRSADRVGETPTILRGHVWVCTHTHAPASSRPPARLTRGARIRRAKARAHLRLSRPATPSPATPAPGPRPHVPGDRARPPPPPRAALAPPLEPDSVRSPSRDRPPTLSGAALPFPTPRYPGRATPAPLSETLSLSAPHSHRSI
jgi:hypothetical protein